MLTGCSWKTKTEPSIPPAKAIAIDTGALQQCSLLKENLTITTFEEGLIAYSDIATLYGQCAKQQSNSIKLLKQFGGIK
jgi:hypothetical protein